MNSAYWKWMLVASDWEQKELSSHNFDRHCPIFRHCALSLSLCTTWWQLETCTCLRIIFHSLTIDGHVLTTMKPFDSFSSGSWFHLLKMFPFWWLRTLQNDLLLVRHNVDRVCYWTKFFISMLLTINALCIFVSVLHSSISFVMLKNLLKCCKHFTKSFNVTIIMSVSASLFHSPNNIAVCQFSMSLRTEMKLKTGESQQNPN